MYVCKYFSSCNFMSMYVKGVYSVTMLLLILRDHELSIRIPNIDIN